MKRFRIALSMLSLVVFLGAAAPPSCKPNPKAACKLNKTWKTVDTYPGIGAAEARGVGADSQAIVVAGVEYTEDSLQPHWLVRRSLDRGEHWEVSDHGPEAKLSNARGVATDLARDEIYVVGSATSEGLSQASSWIVRKSSDHGATWKTVNEFKDGDRVSYALAVAVSGNGTIYVAGGSNPHMEIPSTTSDLTWIVRRSTDHGEHWTTVNTYKPDRGAVPYAIAVDQDERVFVGGREGESLKGDWIVRYSPDGEKDWSLVDYFKFLFGGESQVNGGLVSEDGRVVFVGYAIDSLNKTHWTVRTLRGSSPDDWVTLDDFVPPDSGASKAFGAAFSRNGRLFVTGERQSYRGEKPVHNFWTRTGLGKAVTYKDADLLEPLDPAHSAQGNAAIRDADNDILTVGWVQQDEGAPNTWAVRMLKCE